MAQRRKDIEEQVPEMVTMYEAGASTNKIAQCFGVGHETVRRRLRQMGYDLNQNKLEYIRDSKLGEGMKMRDDVARLKKRLKAGDIISLIVDELDPRDRTVTRSVRRKYRVDNVLPNGVVISGNGKRYMMVTYVELVQDRKWKKETQ